MGQISLQINNEREVLHRWAVICGSTQIDIYLAEFLQNEIKIENSLNVKFASELQDIFCKLITYSIKNGFPMERCVPRPSYNEEVFAALKSEQALVVCLSIFSEITGKISEINFEHSTQAGDMLCRLVGQSAFDFDNIVLKCLNKIDFSNCRLNSAYLWHANLAGSDFTRANLVGADLRMAKIKDAVFRNTYFAYANLHGLNFSNREMIGCNFEGALFSYMSKIHSDSPDEDEEDEDDFMTSIAGPSFINSDLRDTTFIGCDLRLAKFEGANLENATFIGANLVGANFKNSNLTGANFQSANLENVDFDGADLSGANFRGTCMQLE